MAGLPYTNNYVTSPPWTCRFDMKTTFLTPIVDGIIKLQVGLAPVSIPVIEVVCRIQGWIVQNPRMDTNWAFGTYRIRTIPSHSFTPSCKHGLVFSCAVLENFYQYHG